MTTPSAAAAQNALTMQMLCPEEGCPEKIYLWDGYYVPGNPWEIRHQIELYKISLLLVLGCFVWEYAVTWYTEELPRWIEIYKGKIVTVNVLTLISRYFAFGAAATAIIYVWDPSIKYCQFKLTFLIVCVAIMWLAVSLIYTLRIFAMYSKPEDRKTVRLGISIIWFICASLWIASIAGYKAGPTNPIIRQPFGPGCTPLPSPKWYSMGFGAGAIFDLIILILSIRSISRHPGGKGWRPILKAFKFGLLDRSNTSSFIVISSSITFLISFPLNTICFFVLLLSENLILSNIPIAIAALFNFMICSRLVFHSNQWSQGKSALLTMPHTYVINGGGNNNNNGKYDNESNGQRANGFNAFTAAIAKRKINNHPFDQLTIEQAIEEHARMDAIAWRDYMRTGVPDDVKAAVVNAVMVEEERENMEFNRRNSIPISSHNQNYEKSSMESSTRPNSIRGPTRYSSKLEMELAQMDEDYQNDSSIRRGSSTRRGSILTDDDKEFMSNDQQMPKISSKLQNLTGTNQAILKKERKPVPVSDDDDIEMQNDIQPSPVLFPSSYDHSIRSVSPRTSSPNTDHSQQPDNSPIPQGWTRTSLNHQRKVSQTDVESGRRSEEDAPFSSHARSFTPQPEEIELHNSKDENKNNNNNSIVKRTGFKDVFKRQKSNDVFKQNNFNFQSNSNKSNGNNNLPFQGPILHTEVIQTSDKDNFI